MVIWYFPDYPTTQHTFNCVIRLAFHLCHYIIIATRNKIPTRNKNKTPHIAAGIELKANRKVEHKIPPIYSSDERLSISIKG